MHDQPIRQSATRAQRAEHRQDTHVSLARVQGPGEAGNVGLPKTLVHAPGFHPHSDMADLPSGAGRDEDA